MIASARLDVYEEEPNIHEALMRNKRMMLLPHCGTWTTETQTKMEEWCIVNVETAVTEGRIRSSILEDADIWEDEGMSDKRRRIWLLYQ